MPQEQAKPEDKASIWASLDKEDGGAPAPVVAASEEPSTQAEPASAAAEPPKTPEVKPAAEQAAGEDDGAAQVDPYAGLPDSVKHELTGLKAMVTGLTDRLRNAEGHIGGLRSHVQRVAQSTRDNGGEAPSAAEIRKAQANPQAMAKLVEDYPEFGTAMKAALDEQLAQLRSELKSSSPQEQAAAGVSPAELQRAVTHLSVEMQHAGWQKTVQTPAFTGWLTSQPREVQALAASDEPADAIRLLDLHKSATQGAAQRTRRLDSAAAIPNGRSAQTARSKPVDQMSREEYWRYLDEIDKQPA